MQQKNKPDINDNTQSKNKPNINSYATKNKKRAKGTLIKQIIWRNCGMSFYPCLNCHKFSAR